MRLEIQSMKQELSTISMMDEFARYARLERKINKMTDKLKTHGKGSCLSKTGILSLFTIVPNGCPTNVTWATGLQCFYSLSSSIKGIENTPIA
ncbi:UNVERIFIED_CONTAM: hypothetical protein FKN15_027724 [Acipenser sinensis]